MALPSTAFEVASMKLTLPWLKEHLETDAPVEEIARTLTNLGLQVEAVTDPLRYICEGGHSNPDPDHGRCYRCPMPIVTTQ